MRIGSLFSGVGGLDAGLERGLGARTVWQVERNEYARKVLARHWPDVTRYSDVRDVGGDLGPVEVICGGFPCVDLSPVNHRGRGLAGPGSGLWREFSRIVDELRPRAVVVENIAAAWREWVPTVRADLAGYGYASLPLELRALDFGAPHDRARCFVVAVTDKRREPTRPFDAETSILQAIARTRRRDWRTPPAAALGVDDGPARGVDRLRAAGNAVMPCMAEAVGNVLRDWLAVEAA